MRLKKQYTFALIISMLCVFGFGFIVYLVNEHKMTRFDHAIITYVQGLETSWLTRIMTSITLIGDKLQVIILSGLVLIFLSVVLRHRRQLLIFLWVSIGSVALNGTMKIMFKRPRPELYRLAEETGYSFPSGHAMAAVSLYGVLAFVLWRHMPTALARGVLLLLSIVMMLTIGISRIYLGVHYPSDIVAGYLISSCWLALAIWLYQRYLNVHNRY